MIIQLLNIMNGENYKMLVLYHIKDKNNNHHIDVKHNWRNKMFNKSAYF